MCCLAGSSKKGEAFGEAQQIFRDVPLALISAASVSEADEPEPLISVDPALRSSERQRRLPGDTGQRRVLLQMRLELSVSIEGALALSLRELSERRARRGIDRGYHTPANAK